MSLVSSQQMKDTLGHRNTTDPSSGVKTVIVHIPVQLLTQQIVVQIVESVEISLF